MLRIILLLIVLTGCAPYKKFTEKAYIAILVEPNVNGTYYQFINLSYTRGRNFFIHDTAQCAAGDTIIIKDYRRRLLGEKRTLFIKYKN